MTDTTPPNKTALITGLSGQDGSYLAEFLLENGYDVHGTVRRSSVNNHWRIDEVRRTVGDKAAERLHVHYADLADSASLSRLLTETNPGEVYNLAAQSHVAVSFETPESTADVTGTGAARLLEAIRLHNPEIRFYQASSSEMFGSTPPPQNESTELHPRSPYGCAKVYAHHLTINYRESYDMFAVSGILFNHESPRRGENFVTRKISLAAARIKAGLQDELVLGNLDARRDWGFAGDYVKAMWLMLQNDAPSDYVIATGEDHSVEEFCVAAFSSLDMDWRDHVRTDPSFIRPAEVDHLLGDPTKAERELSWKPEISFSGLVELMVEADYQRAT